MPLQRLWASTLAMVLLVFVCEGETPEYRHYEEIVKSCPTNVEKELSGELHRDLAGTWRVGIDRDHPLDRLGSGRRLYLLREDGTGHYWYAFQRSGEMGGGEAPLTWRVEDGHFVVNDLPPFSVEFTPTTVHLRLLEDQRERFEDEVVIWSRCELPENAGV